MLNEVFLFFFLICWNLLDNVWWINIIGNFVDIVCRIFIGKDLVDVVC